MHELCEIREASEGSNVQRLQLITKYFSFQSLDEYEDDEAGQKERKKEDAITQQNTIQNESSSADTSCSYLLQVRS